MKKTCVICLREINEKKDTYFKVTLYSEGKLKGTEYAHKTCWDNKKMNNNKLDKLITGVTDFAVKQGIIQ